MAVSQAMVARVLRASEREDFSRFRDLRSTGVGVAPRGMSGYVVEVTTVVRSAVRGARAMSSRCVSRDGS
jgi:hypothetical protein